MKKSLFHHPNLSLPVIRRRATREFLSLLMYSGEVVATRGRCIEWTSCFPSREAYWSAVSRMRKKGWIAHRHADGRTPVLYVTTKGMKHLPDALNPEKFWKAKWPGTWYMLMYDVPEKDRHYRRGLRNVLKRLRMGCLQKSVWISPRDIRPDFDDLCEAASIGDVALLFEAQTVLGLDPIRVVEQAWSMDQLYSRQEQYLRTFGDKPARIKVQNLPDLQREQLLRDELLAYLQVMDMDPLLPRVLWPDNYRGRDVFDVHRALRGEIARAM